MRVSDIEGVYLLPWGAGGGVGVGIGVVGMDGGVGGGFPGVELLRTMELILEDDGSFRRFADI